MFGFGSFMFGLGLSGMLMFGFLKKNNIIIYKYWLNLFRSLKVRFLKFCDLNKKMIKSFDRVEELVLVV